MKAEQVFNETFLRHKLKLSGLIQKLLQFTFEVGNPELHQMVSDIRGNIEEPFLFVVVGEVKSGKSSFINALLKEDICLVDPAPCTDTVQQILFGETQAEIQVNPYLKQMRLPLDILKSIAIVDTPGTNTIIAHHHDITKNFIPNSDLVIFVFPAKNPHTKTSWDFLDFVSEEWRKKVIFVLQQADLARPEELRVNVEKVAEYAIQRHISAPRVFVTSAERETQGLENSGFDEIRAFIRGTVTGGKHYQLKLQSVTKSVEQVLTQIEQSLRQREQRLQTDRLTAEGIKSRLFSSRKQSQYEIESLTDRLVASYDRIAAEMTAEFKEGLSVFVLFKRSLAALFHKGASVKVWIDDLQKRLENRLQSTLEEVAHEGAQHFLEGIRQLLKSLAGELTAEQIDRPRQTELFERIVDQRQKIISEVKTKVLQLLADDAYLTSLKSKATSIAPDAMGGGALAILGTIIMTVTNITLVDITGGVLTGIGLLLTGGILIFKKGKIVQGFQKRLTDSQSQFKIELCEKLAGELQIIYEDINRSFISFYDYIVRETLDLRPLTEKREEIRREFAQLKMAIEADW